MSAGCPACGFVNPGDAAYCGRCGAELGRTCPSCGAGPLATGLVFCTACGEKLDGAEPSLERKIVSVVFVDVVGYTKLAESLDPEDVRRIIDPFYARVREELEGYGGTVEKFIGDAVMALFGAPTAHEDDAERAVRAADRVREAVSRIEEGSAELQVRIGIATGEAIVAVRARPEKGAPMAHGDVVNTAARIQAAAPVNSILVDERTYRATRFEVEFRQGPRLQLKGKAHPVPVWELVAPRGRSGTDRLRHPRPLVGREGELATLVDLLDYVLLHREPRLVTLVGPPGIGKSRLVWELFQHVDRETDLIFWRQGRSLPYGNGVTFWALAETVKAHAGVLATDPAATVESKLRLAVEDVVSDPNEARWVAGHLAPLAGLAPTHELRGDRRAEAFAAWRRFFEAVAARSPLVLVLEDLHWADDGLLEFVAALAGEQLSGPLLIVATGRPELLERRVGWDAPGAGSTTLELEPLSDDDTARLVADLLEARALPEELRSALLAGAGGNPLYAEEYVRMLVDRGQLRTEDGGLELAGPALSLPESVQAIVAARLDALSPDEKHLLQAAAIVGKAFWLGAVSAIDEEPRWSVEHRLHELERKHLIRRERDSIVSSEPQFSFSHIVVRDVAYEQIPRSVRAERHSRAARWLDALSPERSEDRSEMLAHHYLSALRYVPDSEPARDALVEPARVALREAGDRSLSLSAFAKAADFYAESLALWPREAPDRPDLTLELGRARMHAESGGVDLLEEARDAFLAAGRREKAAEAMVHIGKLRWMEGDPGAFASVEDAAALLRDEPASPAKAFVLSNLATFRMIGDENEKAIAVGLEALEMADELGITELRAHVLDSIGRARARTGDPRGIEDLEESIAIATASNSLEVVRGYANLGNALVEAGELARAFGLYEQGRRAAARFGDADQILWFQAESLYECYWRGRWDEAVGLADDLVVQAEAGSPSAVEQDARLVRGRIRLARDETVLALEDTSRALDLGRHAGYPDMEVPALALHARALEATGRPDEASELLDELLGVWPEHFPTSYWVSDLAFTLAGLGREELLLDAADRARTSSRWLEAARAVAQGDFERACDVYAATGSVPDELLARLGSARQALAAGRRQEAEAALSAALPALGRIGADRWEREGEALLAPSSRSP
jgi:class 3 adenylate cyclase/tetratricopeptide (TPR) repeat protein